MGFSKYISYATRRLVAFPRKESVGRRAGWPKRLNISKTEFLEISSLAIGIFFSDYIVIGFSDPGKFHFFKGVNSMIQIAPAYLIF